MEICEIWDMPDVPLYRKSDDMVSLAQKGQKNLAPKATLFQRHSTLRVLASRVKSRYKKITDRLLGKASSTDVSVD